MPRYIYRKPEAVEKVAKLDLGPKPTRGPSATKATKVSRPSVAKTTENIPRQTVTRTTTSDE